MVENIVFKRYYKKLYFNRGFLNYKVIIFEVDKFIYEFDVCLFDYKLFVKNFLGGN